MIIFLIILILILHEGLHYCGCILRKKKVSFGINLAGPYVKIYEDLNFNDMLIIVLLPNIINILFGLIILSIDDTNIIGWINLLFISNLTPFTEDGKVIYSFVNKKN